MPAINSGRAWEVGFRSAVREGRMGWSVINARGSVRLRVRIKGSPDECVVLPIKWEPGGQAAALQLIGHIYRLAASGQQTDRGALQSVVEGSDTLKTGTNWSAAVSGLRKELVDGRNEILYATWKTNYQQYMEEALRILEGPNPPHDGHGLLQHTLERWKGKGPAVRPAALRSAT